VLPLNAEESKLLKQVSREITAYATASIHPQTPSTPASAPDPDAIHYEQHTLYGEITKAVRANTPSGPVDVAAGTFVRVIARNAQSARVKVGADETTIPLSAIDIPPW
jgi:hypothetical protein